MYCKARVSMIRDEFVCGILSELILILEHQNENGCQYLF